MKIGSLDLEQNVMVIAEIGNNHEGSLSLAKDMIASAAQCGAHAVKFQTIIPEKLVSLGQKERLSQLSKFCFSFDAFRRLKETADKEKIIFLSTPFDLQSTAFLNNLVPAFKIASGDIDFFPLLESIASTGKPIILSTGLSTIPEIKQAMHCIHQAWDNKNIRQNIALLHCVASYPTPLEEANLLCIKTLKKLGVTVGYSDHTIGIEAAVLAVALGARIIEKHFTIDKNYSDFRDHQLSADPDDLAELVRRVDEANAMLGSGIKKPQPCELTSVKNLRRSIVAGQNLSTGHSMKRENLNWTRPQVGLKPDQEHLILGKILEKDIPQGAYILPEHVK